MSKNMAIKKGQPATGKVRLTMLKSTHGQLQMHRDNMRGLGLRRRHQTVELNATPAVLGMVKQSEFMLKVEQV